MNRAKHVFLFLVFCVACAPLCTHAAQQAIVEHFVGTEGGTGSRDGRGAIARFNSPHGVWTDGTFAYVADQNNSTIRKVTIATGDVTTVAGTPQQPQAGRIERPSLVWGDASFLYFVDGPAIGRTIEGGPTVRRLAIATGEITTLAGSTFGLKDGIGPQAQFRGPYAITGNSSHIYVLDPPLFSGSFGIRERVSPAAIREISPSSGEVRTLTPAGFTSDIDPGMLWADDDFLYLVYGTTLGRIRLSDLQFEALLRFPSLLAETQDTARSSSLWGDGLGNLFFNTATNIYRVVLSTGEFSVVASAPPATRRSIAGISGFGNMLVVTDELAQVVFSADLETKQVTTLAGLASIAPSPDQKSLSLSGANGLWRRGNFFYVADTDRSLIYKMAADTGELSTFVSNIDAPAGLWGDENFLYVTQSRDNRVSRVSWQTGEISALNVELQYPASITGDSTYLYIAYQHRFVARISKADGAKTAWDMPGAGSADLQGLWTDGSILYTVDFGALRKMDLSTNQVVILARVRGTVPDTGQPLITSFPSALWSDGKFVYVGGATEIQRFDPGSAQLTTLAGARGHVGAQDGIGETARLNLPGAMWGDAQYLYFTDRSLRRLNLATREVITLAGRVLLLSEGHIPSEQFEATSVTGGGQFLYATSGHAVYKISQATREITHLAGAFNESGTKDGVGSEARFWYPTASFTSGRNLFVADQVNQAVRQIDVDTGRVTTVVNGVTLPVVWGDTNYLYVAAIPFVAGVQTSSTIYRVDLTTREVKTFATGLPEVAHLWGDNTNLYVTETNCTIRRISLSTAEISPVAGSSSECKWPYPPSNLPALVDGSGTEARFGFPNAIWGDGRILYISDGYTLRTVHPMTGETHTIAGDWRIYGSENGVGANARFYGPNGNGRNGTGGKSWDEGGIWGDGTYLYVADRAIRRVTVMGLTMASVNFEVRSGGGDYWKSSTPDPLQVGYARLQPGGGSPQPNGMVIFSFRSQGILVSEASVPASPLIQAGRLYAETAGPARTGIAIANPNDSDAKISFYFTDTAGLNFASAVTTIPAKQQIAAFLDEAPFYGTTTAQSFTFTSSIPVGAIALRGYLNERSDFLMTTLPVAPISSTRPSTAVLPHFASGGGWTTQILLVNPTDDPIGGTVEMVATYTYSIAPRSAAKVVSSNPGTQVRTGFVRINPAAGSPPVASSVFSFVSGGVTVSESGVAATGAGQAFLIFAEVNSAQSMQTGIAVANLSFNTALVQAELLTLDGQASGFAGLLNIPANDHRALFLGELPGFQNLPASFRGVLGITSNTPISVMGMRERYNERGDFLLSAIPAIAGDAPMPSGELVFPHIVTGGGYTTEFLLLNRSGGTSAGTVSLRSQSGADLALPIIK